MGIFSSLFGCKNPKENEITKSPIETLEYAISDVGIWNWWAEDEGKSVQLEFDRAMLYFQTETETPSNRLALRFINPKSVTVLYDKESELPKNWLQLFNEDKIEPFNVDYENFSFDKSKFSKMVAKAHRTETIIGKEINEIDISNANLGFWAGEIGIIILADEMQIVNHSGKIPLENIPKLHNEWWNYWKKYWDLIDTNDKMPYDPLCEITIPATKQNMNKIIENIDNEK
jgi:hypothetical protein